MRRWVKEWMSGVFSGPLSTTYRDSDRRAKVGGEINNQR